ncbi:amino acid adenylation domain-containing protein [Acidipropionibacterium jensenii]|uniref:amino acid adenylation domain-containing protein n=1 Tax=Acidipropionibacterium jensenii TaxID=1749 RepID=UPI0026482CEB|nr:amino acid adenylation domain-containing protein [Acidipropionibacterium jensenii]MDN6425644.1 amino acid adenylation domain-containing protein [Acidipropionibacterium jensenii]
MVVGVDVSRSEDTRRLCHALGREMARNHRHRGYSGVEVIREHLTAGQQPGTAILPVVFTSLLGSHARAANIDMDLQQIYTQTSQVFLDMQVIPRSGSVLLSWDVVPEYFGFDVEEMFEATCRTIEGCAAGGQEVLPVVDSRSEKLQQHYNDTAAPVPGQTLLEAVLASCARHPERTAVVNHTARVSYSYRDLDQMSARIAQHLAGQGCRPGDVVAVETTKHPMSVVNQLGVLRAGCAFLPVGAGLPAQRRRYMADVARATATLADSTYRDQDLAALPAEVEPVQVDPDDPAYIIFTSGSTGRPKGVVISHRGALNTIADINSRFRLGTSDTVIGLSALTFDLSIYDIYGTLAAGARLSMVNDERDADEILEVLRRERVTLWNSTPALLELTLLRAGDDDVAPSLRTLMLSGDRISFTLPARCRRLLPHAEVFSLGGATEASIWSIIHPLDGYCDATAVPYGSPLANQTIHVLGFDRRPCPVGVPGEIWIGGAGLALGYCGDPDRTAASFRDVRPFGRLYRTGDMGVFNAHHWVDFLGRRDRQVKVRGHRIELGEIEAVMEDDPAVSQVVVAIVQRSGQPTIAAFVVPSGPADAVDVAALRARSGGFLPEYMVPSVIPVVDEIPTTANGKVDQRRLQEICDSRVDAGSRQSRLRRPGTAVVRGAAGAAVAGDGAGDPDSSAGRESCPESTCQDPSRAWMRRIWSQVLGGRVTDDEASFFSIGGDSLTFQDLLRRVHQETGRPLAFREIILDPTVRRCCELAGPEPVTATGPDDVVPKVSNAEPDDHTRSAETGDDDPHAPFPLTEMQLAYLTGRNAAFELSGGSEHYYLETEAQIDPERLEDAFNALIARHPMLRCRIDADGTQRILAEVPHYRIERYGAPDLAALRSRMSHEVFAVGSWPMFRLAAADLGEGRHRLFLSIDLIIADGTSQAILMEDLTRFYQRRDPLPVSGTFRDYVVRLAGRSRGRSGPGGLSLQGRRRLAEMVEHFPTGNVLAPVSHPGAAQVLPVAPGQSDSALPDSALPDGGVSIATGFSGPRMRRLEHVLDESRTAQLARQAAAHGVSLSSLLGACYARSLGMWALTDRVGINLTTYNRDPSVAPVAHVVGDFTGIIPVVVPADPGAALFELARTVGGQVLEALAEGTSGMRLISELARRRGIVGRAVAHFVFTALLGEQTGAGLGGMSESVLGRVVHAISQTPQVLLDSQAVERSGRSRCPGTSPSRCSIR